MTGDFHLRRHIVREIIGMLFDVSVVRFLLETGFSHLVFGRRLGVAGSVPQVLL